VSAVPSAQESEITEMALGFMILGAALLFYLEVWALLSRGYTLGLLLTLHRAGRPLDDSELAARYRGGAGLSWIMSHRIDGLLSAGLVSLENGQVVLSPRLGTLVATACKYAIIV